MIRGRVPSITVLMAVYNGDRWLAESIQSVLGQTFTNFEFIIINDGSDDYSPQIISQFAKKDSRIHVYDKENSGLTDSLNYGIEKAQGEWIARIDADDIWRSERLQKQIECVRLNTDLVLVGSAKKYRSINAEVLAKKMVSTLDSKPGINYYYYKDFIKP